MAIGLIAALSLWAAANTRVLAHLRGFLSQVNRDQIAKFEPPAKDAPAVKDSE